MRWLYNVFMWVFEALLPVVGWFNAKARRGAQGRKGWKSRLASVDLKGCLWFHCASLGEFEQARPVLEACKRQTPDARILLTFFSPSGYDVRNDYHLADHVDYLPIDRPSNMRLFLDVVRPAYAYFVKYEVWPNAFLALQERGIPLVMFSAIFRPGHRYFKWYGGLFRRALRACTAIHVQDERSRDLLQGIQIDRVHITGDTRFDRVLDVASNAGRLHMVEAFIDEQRVAIAGSSWPPDEAWLAVIMQRLPAEWKLIIAPHEIDEAHLTSIEARFEGTIRYSQLNLEEAATYRVLIIDNIGMLSKLYQYGHVAYIGGGFGRGIHNVLEAAVFGMPVAFGPNYQRFREAVELLSAKGAAVISDKAEVPAVIWNWLEDPHERSEWGRRAGQFVRSRGGATAQILDGIRSEQEG